MPHDIRIPRLGWSMEEGTFHGWLKQHGDTVAVGDPLFELEGEKAVQTIEAIDPGTLFIPPDAPAPGAVLPVGTLLGYVLAAGETAPNGVPVAKPAESASLSPPPPANSNHVTPGQDSCLLPPAAPSVRRLARELGVSLTSVTGTGPSGRITANDVQARVQPSLTSSPTEKNSSPRARRVARELGINWTQLTGTGRGGRIREADVRRAAQHPGSNGNGRNGVAASFSTAASKSTDRPGPASVVSLSARRKVIAERMRISRDRTVPVTLTATANASQLVSLRSQFKNAFPAVSVPAYTDLLACLAARVLRQHRSLAARWNEDQTKLELPADNGIHIGIAVDTPAGLLVPVLRDVVHLTLADVVSHSQTLIQRARSGSLTAAEMQGGVFTISSLGGFGIDSFTPVINYPEVAILGVGTIRREAVVVAEDRIVSRDHMTLSLTFDHCALDGAPAAAFLRDICRAIENPAPHLLG